MIGTWFSDPFTGPTPSWPRQMPSPLPAPLPPSKREVLRAGRSVPPQKRSPQLYGDFTTPGLGAICENAAIQWCRKQVLARGEAWHWASCGSITGNVCHWVYWLANKMTETQAEVDEGRAYLCKRLGDMWYNSTISAEEATQLWNLAGFSGDISSACGHAPGPSIPPGGPAPTGPFPDSPGPGSAGTPPPSGPISSQLLPGLSGVNPWLLAVGAAGLVFLFRRRRK